MKTVNGLAGSSAAYFIAKHFEQAHIVLPHFRASEDFLEALRYFLPSEKPLLIFPEHEQFYQLTREDPQVNFDRIATLAFLANRARRPFFLVSSVLSLAQKTSSPERIRKKSLYVMKSAEFDRDEFVRQLKALGYVQDDFVQDKGFFSVRGFLVDLFSPFLDQAFRIEFFGDEITSIRRFDPDTQRSLEEVQELEILPCREFVLFENEFAQARKALKDLGDELKISREEREQVWTQIENFRDVMGMRWLLPAADPELCSLGECLPSTLPTVFVDPEVSRRELELVSSQDEEDFQKIQTLAFPPSRLKADPRLNFEDPQVSRVDRLLSSHGITYKVGEFSDLRPRLLRARNFQPLLEEIEALLKQKLSVEIVMRNPKRTESLMESLEAVASQIEWTTGQLFSGFQSQTLGKAFITEKDIFGVRRRHQKSRQVEAADFLREFSDIKDGDFIVHEEHGLGLFRGLVSLQIGQVQSEFALIEYADEDKLYLPIYRLDQLSRYVSGEGYAKPKLDKLGSQSFSKKKAKAKQDILKLAHELMDIAAKRKLMETQRQAIDEALYSEFCHRFPYELTPDQEKSIRDVESDLSSPQPMDRLVCGDVGFGKTEVALRAAFFRALQGSQIAVLAPTTLLAEQHFQGFQKRFEGMGKKVGRLSRFASAKEQSQTLKKLAAGEIDVIIGTHRLLQRDMEFHNLGMLIVDEEQRFGVKHKERIKKLRSGIDVLTLSATPIPRTLQMSIVGIRDLSLITTAPDTREAVSTFVGAFDPHLIRQAAERERARGGQILFVHNRVKSILRLKEKLTQILPGFQIAIAHGQMPEDDLEAIMLDYVNQKYEILLATSIIENGLDIPNANTIFVDHAEQFGLSDLYQLRGRVGRSHRKAYSYFLIHEDTALTEEASKRLQVIQNCTELGSGFRVATHDLEIRGSGNLLGEAQSGVVSEVGLELYNQMLEDTLAELRHTSAREELPELNAGYTAFIPESYVPDPSVRISTYRQLNRMTDIQEILRFEDEIKDRFGPYPEPVRTLLSLTQIRIYASLFKAKSLDCFPGRLTIDFHPSTPLTLPKLRDILSKKIQIDPKGRLNFQFESAHHKPQLLENSSFVRTEDYDFAQVRSFFRRLAQISDIRAL